APPCSIMQGCGAWRDPCALAEATWGGMTMGNGQRLPGQVVLVLQGGGALGAYQGGVYEALHSAGIEPDWVIGTSIGAINGALIAGNAPADRLPRLREFWQRVAQDSPLASLTTFTSGLPAFFVPKPLPWGGVQARVGLDEASFYSTVPLRSTLSELLSLDRPTTRLTVGAVKVRNSEMRYFDSRTEPLSIDHVMASVA